MWLIHTRTVAYAPIMSDPISRHPATIEWKRGGDEFSYRTYPRDHTWTFESGVTVAASAAPKFFGTESRVDPEEAFVASLSSCHMLTFLAIACKRGHVVDTYKDHAEGVLAKNEDGRLAVTKVTLSPKIAFSADPPDADQLAAMHHEAHERCFIANSVRTAIEVR